MRRRRYRTIRVVQRDKLLAEAEAVDRALRGGVRRASVSRATLISDHEGRFVWEIELRVVPFRRSTRT